MEQTYEKIKLNKPKNLNLEKLINPNWTDTKYFFKAIFNILFRHKRSA